MFIHSVDVTEDKSLSIYTKVDVGFSAWKVTFFLCIRGLRTGPGKLFVGVLESPGFFFVRVRTLDVFQNFWPK